MDRHRTCSIVAAAVAAVMAACTPARTGSFMEVSAKLPFHTLAPPEQIGISQLKFPTRQIALPSGVTMVLEQAPTRGMVGVVLTVGAGSTSDPPGREGLAHLVEHLNFHARPVAGGPGADLLTVHQVLSVLGATFNATTLLDTTQYSEVAPRAALPALLRLAASRLSDPLAGVGEAQLELERAVVTNELRQRGESGVYGHAFGWLQRALMPAGHPYARPLLGQPSTLKELTLEGARAFARAHYRPENATLLVVMEELSDEVVERVKGELPPALLGNEANRRERARPAKVSFPTESPEEPDTLLHPERGPVAAPELWVGWFVPTAHGNLGALVRLATAAPVVTAALKARLPPGEVRDVEIATIEGRLATFLVCRVELARAGKQIDVAEVVTEEMAALWQPYHPREVASWLREAAKAEGVVLPPRATSALTESILRGNNRTLIGLHQTALAHLVFSAESYLSRALARADHLQLSGEGRALEKTLVRAANVTTDELALFAQKYLSAERARVLYVEPLPATERPPPAAVGVPGTRQEIAEMPVEQAARLPPPLWQPAPQELQQMRRVRLPSGIDLILLPRPHFQGVTVALGFRGGTAAGSPRGVVELLRRFQPAELVTMPLHAISPEVVTLPDFTADVVRTGSGNLSNALFLLRQRLRQTHATDWRRTLGWTPTEKALMTRSHDAPPRLEAERKIYRALYADHPYGREVTGKEIVAVDGASMTRWLERMHDPRNVILVIAGDIQIDRAESLAHRWFQDWTAQPRVSLPALPPVPPPPATGARETVLVTHRPGLSQTELTIACRLPADGPRALAINNTMASLLGSYLQTRFRAESGASYGVVGGAHSMAGGAHHLVLTMSVDDLRLQEVVRSVRGHWRQLAQGSFDEGALSQVLRRQAAAHNLAYQTSAEVALEVLATAARGDPVERLVSLPADNAAVTTADLARTFATCRAHTVLSFIGDEPTVRAAL